MSKRSAPRSRVALCARHARRSPYGLDDTDARANLAIKSMALTPDEDALFDMLRDEAVPPRLATAIVLKLLGHPDADPALPITPLPIESAT